MSTLFGLPLRAAGLAVAVALASPAWAMPAGPAVSPNYEDLIARLDDSPITLEADALSAAASARADQARALPNPTLSVDGANLYGSGQYAGRANAETTVALTQPLELWGKRGARIAAARAEAQTAGLRRHQQRWMAAGQLAAFYAEAEAATRRLALATEALSLIEQDAGAVQALVREGREPRLRSIQAQSEVEAARASLDQAGALQHAALARLTAIASWAQPITTVGNSLLDRTPAAPVETVSAPLSVRIAEADLQSARERITVEKRRALPDISASVGHRRFQSSGENATTLGLALTIPLFDRNRGNLRAAHADARAAEARLMAQTQNAQAERLAAEAGLRASHSRTLAADSGVAAAEEAYRLARIGYDAGRISQLELRGSRTALIASRYAAVDARMSRVAAEIDLALLDARAPFVEIP